MKEALTRFLSRLLWGLIEGSSEVVFNWEEGEVSKVHQPRLFIRLLHFFASQRWTTLYERVVGLQIARLRREIAGYVLQCGGINCRIAPCLRIEMKEDWLVLVTKLIRGRQPRREEIMSVTEEVTALFLRAGFPTWSVCPAHPRLHTNFVIDAAGVPWIVDGESHVLSIFVPFEELRDNILLGNFPPFDDIHFPKLWRYYHAEAWRLPEPNQQRFRTCIEECETLVRLQKSEEIRIWSRILNALLRSLRVRKG